MKTDISNRSDIQVLIDSFYTKVRADDTIGYIFNDVAKVNWEQHLPRMYDFWESIIFQSGNFRGNPMAVHVQLHQRTPLLKEHFDRWLALFNQTVDELFEGNNAELAKQRALSIATMMRVKIAAANDSKSIL
jgi:Truncated hemoglobins